MSAGQTFFLRSEQIKQHALSQLRNLPTDQDRPLVIKVTEMTRSLEQNALLWAVLTDIANQVDWYGKRLSKEDWKHVLSAALKQQEAVPGINGGFVVLGQSTSKMTVREMVDLIELAQSFAVDHGVKFGDDARRGIEWAQGKQRRAA